MYVIGFILLIVSLIFWNGDIALSGIAMILLGFVMTASDPQEESNEDKYEPLDLVRYIPTQEKGIVKKTTNEGVYVIFDIHKAPIFCKYSDIELVQKYNIVLADDGDDEYGD